MLEVAVRELKQEIDEHDGVNVVNRAFARRVDELIDVFYDDIGAITDVSTETLFDLFVIKVLYIERRSTDAAVVAYLGRMLEHYLDTRELFPAGTRPSLHYLSDLLRETQQGACVENLFEAYRTYGDNSLFLTGVFPRALRGRRRGRAAVPFVDRAYYVSTGSRCYLLAAQQDMAELTRQRELLEKLSTYFEIYLEALNELSERYIMGFDLSLIADKMLDSFNRYRQTGEERFLESTRRYAALLKVDPDAFAKRLRLRLPPGEEPRASV